MILKQAFDTSNLEGNALSWVLELSKILHTYSAIEKKQGEWYIFEPVENDLQKRDRKSVV